VVELEDGQIEVERQRAVGFKLLMQDEVDSLLRDARDFGPMQEAGGDDIEDLARLGAEHTR
jgi:hypothetical protein